VIRRSSFGRALAAVLMATCVASCVSIPDSGPVGQAVEVGVEDQSQQLTNVVLGPFDGASPAEVVQGFFVAMTAYPQTMDKARLFLTDEAAAAWNPDTELRVYSDVEFVPSGRSVNVSLTLNGALDERGSWTSATPGDNVEQAPLNLRQDGGEWRIDNPSDGILVDAEFFRDFYEPYSLYFFDPSLTILTPDPVYLPGGETAATTLVRDLLQGPTADLKGAVTSAVPADTELDVGVSISRSGVADVPLSPNVIKLLPADRKLFAAQLAWTLRQVPGVEQIFLSVAGQELPIENVESPFAADSFAGYDPAGLSGERRLFALGKDGPVTLNAGQVSPVQGPIREVTGGASIAVQTSGQLAAVVDGDRRTILVGAVPSVPDEGVTTWFSGGTKLLRPSWDAQQVLWVVDQTESGARIYTVTADGARPVESAPGLVGANILAFGVSRDGIRMAAIVEHNGVTRLKVATIDRRDPEDPTRAWIRAPRTVANVSVNLTELHDVAWVSPTSLAVLGRVAGGDVLPYEVAIDGSETQEAGGFPPANPKWIAAGPNVEATIAVSAGHQISVQTPDGQWLKTDPEIRVRAPAYPG
jgi:hypothetical protein